MRIGIPKEIMHGERRVAATPETVKKLIADGAEVWVQQGAGEGAFFHDAQYAEAGARLVADPAEMYAGAEVILKVKEPQFNHEKSLHEIDMMHAGQVLITFIHPASPVNHEMVMAMAKKGIIGLTLDGVPRISRAQNMDALTSMSTCAGYKGILLAANELPRFIPQIFSAVGMIRPIQALVVGVGVGGLQALATVKRLGAVVHAADIRPAAAEQAKSLGAKVIDLGIPAEAAVGAGGYALALSEAHLQQEREALAKVLPQMDIVFLSALVPSKIAPVLITEEMVKTMKPGSAIVDISIDQGGNCAITPPGETEVKHNVTLIGIKNIPGMLPESSSQMFAQNIYNLTKYLTKDGKIALDRGDEIVQGILTTIDGELVHQGAREAMGI
ncbi:MAG: NAD(P) transhydrogenase subunit alpha [Oscillospiraceae bacterium]|jgi:NAD(P) transhydrogenase subunit alpha|nr:NAD(P) transhydrogenase subunit alpha [Oscillospiraceae bacterium]